MKLIPLSRASFTMRVVSSLPRLPMFILPPNCIVPSATLLTISPVFPSFLYFISTLLLMKRRLRLRYLPHPHKLSPCLGIRCGATSDLPFKSIASSDEHFERHCVSYEYSLRCKAIAPCRV